MFRKKQPVSKPISSKTSNVPIWVLLVFFGFFFFMGAGFLYGFFVRPALKSRAAGDWAETPCEIRAAEVQEHRGNKGSTYSIAVEYAYSFGGREYTSHRYSFFSGSSSGYASKKAAVDRLLRERRAICYVNTADPREAVLVRELGSEAWLALIPLVFVLFGAIGMFFTVRHALRRLSARPGWPPGAPVKAPRRAPVPKPVAASGPVTLRPSQSRLGRFLAIAIFALVWNAVVVTFLVMSFSWFLLLFAAIGVLIIGLALYFFLALFNPRPLLTASSAAALPGARVSVKWEFRGSTGRIEKLTLSLEGREEAMYRSGKNSHMAKDIFANVPVAEVTDPRDLVAGRAEFTVPAGAIHSFTAPNNKIIWALKVHGEIRFWPDVDEEFPFTVLPLPAGSKG